MYKFSVPMPYSQEDIDKILGINNNIKKSKITSMYGCLPSNCELFTGFEQGRNFSYKNTDFKYWKDLISHTISKGCDFIYLLNKPNSFDSENNKLTKQIKKLDKLLKELKFLGVKKLRIASPQLMTYIGKYYNDFEVLASTSLEYKTICEYQNFINFHNEVKQIIPSHDINKNFNLINCIKKEYPDLEIEIMVNEGCLKGCPHRLLHEMCDYENNKIINNELIFNSALYCTLLCNKITAKYPIASLTICTHIFPWEIYEYSRIGINNFKLVGRDGYLHDFKYYLNAFNMYLQGIDSVKNINDYSLSDFIHHLSNDTVLKHLTVKNYKQYLPKISHFKKYGHLCASRCGVECRYCYKCAERIQKVFEKKQKEERKRNTPFCVINK